MFVQQPVLQCDDGLQIRVTQGMGNAFQERSEMRMGVSYIG